MDRGAWQATVHGVAKSRTLLSEFTYFTSLPPCFPSFHPLVFTPYSSQSDFLKINFILGGSKITADGDCSHEIK